MKRFGDVGPRDGPIEQPLRRCPGCSSDNLRVVPDSERDGVVFRCALCDACWHVELGYVQRVRISTSSSSASRPATSPPPRRGVDDR